MTPPRIAPAVVAEPASPAVPEDLSRPDLYFNRELSWIEFNRRVLDEAADLRHPLLERIKFGAIFTTNLDEFFMIRVSGLREQVAAALGERSPDGLTPTEQLTAVREQLLSSLSRQRYLLHEELLPALAEEGIRIVSMADLTVGERAALDSYYQHEVFPVLTPLGVDPGHPFPHISNLSLNLAVAIEDPQMGRRLARLKIPNVLPRFIPIPPEPALDGAPLPPPRAFVPLEQLIAANLGGLFSGLSVIESFPFQVIRDADIEIVEDEASDLSLAIEQSISERRFGSVVCLMVDTRMPESTRTWLMDNLEIGPTDVYTIEGMLALSSLMELYRLDHPQLKDPPLQPRVPPTLHAGEDIFAAIASRDQLLHHPYESFGPVVDLLQAAARDPNVLAIKQTLYRVGGSHAPVVDALLAAAAEGKQVAVLVELKARFDEENNLEWARALERAGAHVAYGLVGLKTHAKVLLIVRKERDGLRRYVHLGTGNYNSATARVYTDFGLMTTRPDIGEDVSELFNYLTGYSRQDKYRKLLVAPVTMRQRLLYLIEREIEQGEKGHIVFKMNQLTDTEMIATLYRASQAGVRVELIVRGICCLRPGLPGISERIRVTSLVGRFLEHSRLCYFGNGGDEQIYLGSADLMSRNLNQRVETLFPVEDPQARARLLRMLAIYRRDTANTHILQPDGSYTRRLPGEAPFDAQAHFVAFDG